MNFYNINKLEFNGYLHSLRYICDSIGFEEFCQENECDLYRVKSLYHSDIHGSNYILSLLWAEDFEKDLKALIIKNQNRSNRMQKYYEDLKELRKQLSYVQTSFCGIGFHKTKRILTYCSNTHLNAKIADLILDIENFSIKAKVCSKEYREYNYFMKKTLILKLIDLYNENDLNYGFMDSDIPSTESTVFFDTDFGQVSWHTVISKDNHKLYSGSWDNRKGSTFFKLEKFIKENFISNSTRV